MQQLEIRKGFVKFQRLGTIEFGKQDRWNRAPLSNGMWAFPYPYFDMFFAYHKYTDLLPKRLRTNLLEIQSSELSYEESQALWAERDEWVNTVGKKILPMRTFWYSGNLFSHIAPNGMVGDAGTISPESTEWFNNDAVSFAKTVKKNRGNKGLEYIIDQITGKGIVSEYNYSIDHLEVFIPQGQGKILHRAP